MRKRTNHYTDEIFGLGRRWVPWTDAIVMLKRACNSEVTGQFNFPAVWVDIALCAAPGRQFCRKWWAEMISARFSDTSDKKQTKRMHPDIQIR